MKTLNEMESTCSRILSVLEHDDLRRGSLATLSTMLVRLRSELERYLAEWRSVESDSPQLRSAQESLRSMNASLLWLQEYAEIQPLVVVSQRLRMATLRALQIIATLQHARHSSMSGVAHAPSERFASPTAIGPSGQA